MDTRTIASRPAEYRLVDYNDNGALRGLELVGGRPQEEEEIKIGTQQSIGSPGVGDSFRILGSKQQSATATLI